MLLKKKAFKKKLKEAALYRDFQQDTADMNEERMRRILAQQIRAQQNAQLQSEGAANLNQLLNIGYWYGIRHLDSRKKRRLELCG